MRLRIDTLSPGTVVRLQFGNDPINKEIALFVGIKGEGEERCATFTQVSIAEKRSYEWDAYRYAGRWAYGSSAQSLRLVEVIA